MIFPALDTQDDEIIDCTSAQESRSFGAQAGSQAPTPRASEVPSRVKLCGRPRFTSRPIAPPLVRAATPNWLQTPPQRLTDSDAGRHLSKVARLPCLACDLSLAIFLVRPHEISALRSLGVPTTREHKQHPQKAPPRHFHSTLSSLICGAATPPRRSIPTRLKTLETRARPPPCWPLESLPRRCTILSACTRARES